MSVPTLAAWLERRDRRSPAIVTSRRSLDVGELLDRAAKLPVEETLEDGIPVLRGDDVATFATGLLALDGRATALLCVPRGEPLHPAWVEQLREGASRPLPSGSRTRWILGTSGTTGTPKLVAHDLATLTTSTKADLARGERHRWALLYDPARFAGLQVVLQALIGGGVLVAPPTDDPVESVAFLAAHGVNTISATPTLWRKLLMAPAAASLDLLQITLGGEIADDAVLRALRRRYPAARIVHIYASTEAGVGFAVGDGRAGFPASYLEPGALAGVELKVDERGHLRIRKPIRASYVGPDEDDGGREDGFLDTGDLVRVEGDRVFFRGRASGAINVGGNKVSPEEIEALLLEHPAVVGARVHARRSSMTGNLVAADLQLRPGSDPAAVRAEVVALCRERLPRWQRPAIVKFVDELEVGAAGKLARKVDDGA